MQRLRELDLYKNSLKDKSLPAVITLLVKNYRSHPNIIEISSALFYNGELTAFADKQEREHLVRLSFLPRRGFPMFIHGINGKDERSGNSPSWFNIDEIKAVKKLVESLLSAPHGFAIKPTSIGVISFYRQQVQKITSSLNNTAIKVGSVEEFQGQERDIIIISTVRSNPGNIQHGMQFFLYLI